MNFSDYKFGLRGHDIADNFEAMCRHAEEIGVHNLQFAPTKTIKDIDFDSIGYDDTVAANIKSSLTAHNLSISVLGCYINPIDADDSALQTQLRRFKNFIKYAKTLGAGMVGTETGFIAETDGDEYERAYQKFITGVRTLTDTGEALGVTVAIEPVWSNTVYSPKVMRRVLDDINSDSLGVILDMSNIINAENYETHTDLIDEAFELFGNKIRAVHVKDFNFEDGKKSFAVVGEGMLNIKYLFDKISALPTLPEIILDELPAKFYGKALENLKKIL